MALNCGPSRSLLLSRRPSLLTAPIIISTARPDLDGHGPVPWTSPCASSSARHGLVSAVGYVCRAGSMKSESCVRHIYLLSICCACLVRRRPIVQAIAARRRAVSVSACCMPGCMEIVLYVLYVGPYSGHALSRAGCMAIQHIQPYSSHTAAVCCCMEYSHTAHTTYNIIGSPSGRARRDL